VIDDFCKRLWWPAPAASIGRWLLGLKWPVTATQTGEHQASDPGCAPDWQLIDRELSSDPLHADSLILLNTNDHRMEALGDSRLVFQCPADLEHWLNRIETA